jgi:hypothetical protein
MKADYYGAVLLGAVVLMSFLVLFYMIFDAEATSRSHQNQLLKLWELIRIVRLFNTRMKILLVILICYIARTKND